MHLVLVVVVVVLVLPSRNGLYCLHLTTKLNHLANHVTSDFRFAPPPPFCDESCLKVTQKTTFFVTVFPYLILFENM